MQIVEGCNEYIVSWVPIGQDYILLSYCSKVGGSHPIVSL